MEEKLNGLQLIAKERSDQLNKHGISIEWDTRYNSKGALRKAAEAILSGKFTEWPTTHGAAWTFDLWDKIKAKPVIEQLVIAGALLAAEIDRLQYKDEGEGFGS